MILCIVAPPVGTVYAAAMKRFGVVLAGVAAALMLTACGGDDTGDDGSGSGSGGGSDSAALEQAVKGVFTNQGLTDYDITDDTLTITLDEGSAQTEDACVPADAIAKDDLAGRTVVLEFPDGEVTCDDAGG